ncbi:GDP-mannose mannosyl hydrolase [Lacisediminimonas profundi]|uniref:GDP-mannose mannosyl hydrolase n=1 Tax=Lacisediminimonas profundi TaxID=2603856 RepID=UPI001F4FEF0F|nr:NUDIX domain-containing protein [Lacisediminimonas profundi]
MTTGWLDHDTFRAVVSAAPLVSIDVLVLDEARRVLLGLRNNRPAQGQWFAPGGRVCKGESLDVAFNRITRNELGHEFNRRDATFVGPYEHFYPDSVFGSEGNSPSTHYVVLAYCIFLDPSKTLQPHMNQHSGYDWWSLDRMAEDTRVHNYTRQYAAALNKLSAGDMP